MTKPTPIVTTNEHLRYENDYIRVYNNDVIFPSGRVGTYLRIGSAQPGRGIVVLIQTKDRVALVRTYRYPTDEWEWALPRGFSHGTDSAATARTEIMEEVGIQVSELELIGSVTPDSGLLSTRVDVYRARLDFEPDTHIVDTDEVHELAWVDRAELARRIAAGEITDGLTLAALTLDRCAEL